MSERAPGLVTVIGGSGFIGTQVVHALARRGWRVRVAVRRPDKAYKAMTSGAVGQIQPFRCDVTKEADVANAVRGADAVVSLVGVLFEQGDRTFHAMHVEAAERVAEACAAAGVDRLVHMSAIGANPESPSDYGLSKGVGEMRVREIKPDAVVIRPSLVFGAGDDLLNKFAQMAQFSPALPLIGGGRTKFQPVHVGDVAEAIARCVERDEASGRTFELGGPGVMTFEDILKLVLRETHRSRALVPLPFFVARVMGALSQLSTFVGVKPVLTRDQVLMLQIDNMPAEQAEGLRELEIEPTGMEAVAESYLWRYRRGGQFAERPA